MTHLHHYVPMSESYQDATVTGTSQTVNVAKASVHQILIEGDQLTAANSSLSWLSLKIYSTGCVEILLLHEISIREGDFVSAT